MNINQKIQEFLTEHQYQKKRRIFTAVLSLMIVFSVVSSLIMPAISMTMQDLDDAAAVDTIDAEPAEENIMLLGESAPIDLAKRATESGGSFDISIMDEDTKNNVDGNYIFNGDKAKIAIYIGYQIKNMKNKFKKSENGSSYSHLYLDIKNVDFMLYEGSKQGQLSDEEYTKLSNIEYAGTYSIDENGRVSITLTDDYIDYIDGTGEMVTDEDGNKHYKYSGSDGTLTGTLNFSGELSRKNDASGDQTINIGGQDIIIHFQDKQAGVAKNYWVDSSKGEIEWTITVKPNGLSLKDYTLVDNMLQKASGDVFINPSNAATYNPNDKKVTFDESNTGDVTIKYRTKIGTEDLKNKSVTNKATLQKNGENPIEDSKTVYLDKTPIHVTKDGKADYENGKSRGNKIDWTITITSEYGTSLNGYQIIDDNLPENGVTISPSGGTLTKNGNAWVLSNVPDGTKTVTLNYSADATDGDNKNSVSIHYPDGSPTGGNTEKTVHYKKESEMISVNKNGNYNQDTHEITWTIQVTPVNGYSLKDYYLEDSQFPSSIDQFTASGCNTSDFKIENGRLTFTSDIKQAVTLQYKTKVSVPNNDTNAEVTTVVTNEIKDKFTKTTVVSVSVKSRNTIAKTARSQNMSLSQSNAISQEFSWKVDITRDNGFDGYIYKDTLSASANGTQHTITTDEQLAALKILAKTQEYGNATELKQGTDYNIVKDTNGFHIEFLSTTKDYNYISFEYNTTATIPADAAYGQYTFNNKGSSNKGGGTPNPGVTIEKKNPVQTISIFVRKDWDDHENSANDRPTSITFKVQYQENNGEWKVLKKSGDTYLFEGDADYSSASVVEVTLNAENKASWTNHRWETTLSGLPSSVTMNGNTKTYRYRVQEIKYNDNQAIENGVFSTENGVYRNTGGGYSSPIEANNGEALVINKYYPNVSLQPVKYWKDGNNQDITNYHGDITDITVVLVSKESDGKFYPVKDSNGNQLTATLNASNNWGKDLTAWNGLSSEKNYLLIETAVKLKNGTTENLFSVSDSGTDYNSKEMSFAVDGTYYKATLLGNSVQPTADTTISVTNTVYETKNITVQAKKEWNPSKPDGVSGVVVELQRKASNLNDWTAYPENNTAKSQKTLNDGNSWKANWNDLPNQNVDNTGRISYTYRVVEVGYVKADGTTVVSIQNDKFALANAQGNADGLYEASYVNQELTKDGTVQITNTYKPLTPIELTPEKKWEGDIDSQTQNPFAERPKSITLQLQQKLGENGKWTSMAGKTLTLTKDDQYQYDKSTWKSDSKKFENLPEKVIRVNADGSYTEQKYYYRLVEINYTPDGSNTAVTIPDGDTSFDVTGTKNNQTFNGRYSFSSDENSGFSGSLKITNTYREDIGVRKNIVVGTSSFEDLSIQKDELSQFEKTIGTEKYYIFNYIVDFSSSQVDAASPISDILPEGFELCCDDSKWAGVQLAWINGSTINQYTPLTGNPGNISNHFDGYYEQPVFVWPTHGINSAKPTTLENIWANWGSSEWYYYDRTSNRVYFNRPDLWAKMYICYSIKIKCEDLEAKIASGNYEIVNQVIKHERNGTETDKKDSASLIIKNQTPTDLITKTYQSAALPGYISYTLDINPQGKTLSSGDTIDIEDLFKTVSYYDSDWNGGETTNGTNLVDVLMRNINIYKIDANGDKQQLSANEYTLQFDCSENGVQSDGEKGAALLKLTVPDATHLQVTYSYKIIANKNTPSVIHGCKVRKNGRYVPMESGLVPPAGDKITFSNTAKLKADSASGESSHNNQEYTVFQSGGTISTNPIPKIYKVNTGDYTIKSLHASFLLAKYESGNWYYASNVNADGAITWGKQSFNGKNVPATNATDAYVIKVEGTQPKISLEQNVLYKLVEISVPAGYEGSNLNLSSTDFRALVTGYLNSNLTDYNGQDYATFLNHYNPNHYFSFNSNVSGNHIPHDVSQSEIQQIKSGDDLNIPNNELIDIGVQKQWVNSTNTIPENASITVELYWSYEKSTSGIPASATLAKAEDLGILDSSFTATKTLKDAKNAKVWTDLPNGKAGKPIYYYVKEIAYTYGGNTYTLQEDGSYKDGSDLGGYLPIYQNNAANGDATVQIQNTQRLMLKKVWKDINNQDMKPLLSSVDVMVYGIKVDAAGNETKEALFTNSVTLGDTNSWQLDITSLIGNKDLSVYKRFEVTETGVDTSNMVISCVFNLNQNTGEIIVTNKSTQPTDASVTVQKAWSDGETLHASESVQVSLYQSTKALPANTELTAAWITANATKMTDTETATYTVQLNKDNEWTYTWTDLPLKNESEQPYYYYVLEDLQNSAVANKDKYTATYTKSSNSTAYKTNYTITNSRSAITVQKQWYDEDGNLITNLYDEDGNLIVNNMANLQEITLKVYKKTGTVPTDPIGIVAFGDSITDGYNNSWETGGLNCSKNEKCYPSKLTTMLTAAGFKLKNDAVANKGNSGEQIGEAGNGFRSRVTSDIPADTKIVCLLGGTNDIHQGGSSVKGDPDGVFNRLQGLISEIKTQAPDATIFVGSIPHFDFYKNETLTTGGNWWNWLSGYAVNDGAKPNGLIDEYNAKIKAYAEETAGVYFVDVCSVVTDDDIRADGCHPNEAGYTKIATAYSNAIQDYYTNKEYLKDSNNQDLTITLNNDNNWRAAIDVPAVNDTYCVEEVNVPDGWDVTYENNAQQANSTTPILVKNQKQPTDIDLTVEKTWAKDDASNRPDSISLTLLRSNRKKQDNSDAANTSEWFWEELRISTPTPTKNGNKWTFAYTGLPAKDVYGNDYHYKVQEAAVNGYTVSYGLNGAGEENGVTAAAGETATLHVTNTRAITLQIEKQWSDGATNQHLKDAVRVRIYRSTNPSDVPTANLTLQVTPETVSVGVNGTATVTANKKITVKEIANDTIANATISEDGKTLTITGEEAGETTITVTDGTMEKQIFVTVSVEPTLNLSISPANIRVGETATLTPSMSDGSDCSGVTYSITAGNDFVSISGNTVTGSKAGTATIVAERNGKTSNPVTITVTEPPLNLNPESVTVSVGDTATIQANRTVTISQDPDANIATASVSGKNITVTGVAAGSTSFTVRDSDGREKTVSVTVNQKTENELTNNRGDSNNFKSQITGLEVGDVISVTMYGTAGTSAKGCFGFNDTSGQWQAYQWGAKNVGSDGKLTVSYTIPNNYANGNHFEFQIWQWNELSSKITKITYTVQKSAPAITLTASSTTLKAKETLQLTSNVTGVNYSSSDPQVATVNANGLVTGVAAGSVRITATKDGCTAGTIDLTVKADVKEFPLARVSAGKTITVIVTGTAGTTINGCFGYNDTGSGATNGWYQWEFGNQEINSDGKLTLTHKVRDTYNGNGNAVFQVWHNNSAVSDITYTISDSSSGGGESGGGSFKWVSVSKNNTANFSQHKGLVEKIRVVCNGEVTSICNGYANFKNGDSSIKSIYVDNTSMTYKENNYFVFDTSDIKDNLTDFVFNLYNSYNGSMSISVTGIEVYVPTTPQSLSAPRRAVAAAAVIESEQLLSAANETAGVQTQALENTIDASEVSDSDWASGLLLEIDATDHWQGSVTNLPVTDSNGNTYYYWAVEEPVTGYTPSYLFQDADGSQSNAIKADVQVDGTDIIVLNTKQDTSYTLPSTGGTGVTRYYLIGLLLMGGSGLVVCYQFRRKRHGNCAK